MNQQPLPAPHWPLDELDRRQDEILKQLDQLNADVMALLDELTVPSGKTIDCRNAPADGH